MAFGNQVPDKSLLQEVNKKLIRTVLVPEKSELYDLEKDPQEMINLAHVPEFRNVRERLSRRMLELRKELSDPDW